MYSPFWVTIDEREEGVVVECREKDWKSDLPDLISAISRHFYCDKSAEVSTPPPTRHSFERETLPLSGSLRIVLTLALVLPRPPISTT